jgi:hypothetical protein
MLIGRVVGETGTLYESMLTRHCLESLNNKITDIELQVQILEDIVVEFITSQAKIW